MHLIEQKEGVRGRGAGREVQWSGECLVEQEEELHDEPTYRDTGGWGVSKGLS